MTQALVVCAGCHRHHRASESACPFCGALVGAPLSANRPGALHTAVIAAALALAATQNAAAQVTPPGSPRLQVDPSVIAAYGAPPLDPPVVPEPRETVPSPDERTPPGQALLSLSSRALRDAPRPRSVWRTDLVVRLDGTWIGGGQSGRLRPAQLAALRAEIARARLGNAPRPRVTCDAIPNVAERVTIHSRSVSWTSPCGTSPDPSVARLVTLARRLTINAPR